MARATYLLAWQREGPHLIAMPRSTATKDILQMLIRRTNMQMSLAGNITQDRWIRSQDPTAMVKSGMMMEIFILADT